MNELARIIFRELVDYYMQCKGEFLTYEDRTVLLVGIRMLVRLNELPLAVAAMRLYICDATADELVALLDEEELK